MASTEEEESGGNFITSFLTFLKDSTNQPEENAMSPANQTNGQSHVASNNESTKDSQMGDQSEKSESDSNASKVSVRKRKRELNEKGDESVHTTPRRTSRRIKKHNVDEENEDDDSSNTDNLDLFLSDSDDDPDFAPSENKNQSNTDIRTKRGKISKRRVKSIGGRNSVSISSNETDDSNSTSSLNLPYPSADENTVPSNNNSNSSDSAPKRRGRPPVYQALVNNDTTSEISNDSVSSTSDTLRMSANKLSSAYHYSSSRTRQNQAIRLPEGPNLTEEQMKIIESQFKSGDFVMGKRDIDGENPPIWRIDGKSLLQKFQAFETNGKTLYRNISTYSGWTTQAKALYVPVKVNFAFQSRYDTVVELIGLKGLDGSVEEGEQVNKGAPGSKAKELQIVNTMKLHMPSFEIYLQTLISQALDSNFLQEIYEENDTYFVERLNIIDSMILEKREKLKQIAKWNENFQNSLDSWPCVNSMATKNPVSCQACDATTATRLSQFYGQPYDPLSLRSREPSTLEVNNKNFDTCDDCSVLCQLYNKVVHQKYDFYSQCKSTVTSMRVSHPNKSTSNVLRDLLANDSWICSLFRTMCTAWSKVDTVYEEQTKSNSLEDKESGVPETITGEHTTAISPGDKEDDKPDPVTGKHTRANSPEDDKPDSVSGKHTTAISPEDKEDDKPDSVTWKHTSAISPEDKEDDKPDSVTGKHTSAISPEDKEDDKPDSITGEHTRANSPQGIDSTNGETSDITKGDSKCKSAGKKLSNTGTTDIIPQETDS